MTWAGSTGAVKLGQPQWLSNFSVEANSGSPETMSTYRPASLWSQNSLSNAGSVPLSWVTWYCSLVKRDTLLRVLLVVAPASRHSFRVALIQVARRPVFCPP